MKVQTFSVLVGNSSCNAKCPFCISRMTGSAIGVIPTNVNWLRFARARDLAVASGATTMMLTGKGEPTLWPYLITKYIKAAKKAFPIVELQTNGLTLSDYAISEDTLDEWKDGHLVTIALSLVHWDRQRNTDIYGQSYDIQQMVDELHGHGFSVRLCVTMLKGYIDDFDGMRIMAFKAKEWGVEQLTFTPVNAPAGDTKDPEAAKYVAANRLSADAPNLLHADLLGAGATPLLTLSHGGLVMDYNGQNVCLNNCLGPVRNNGTMRNIIFHPDGHVRFNWTHESSIVF